jgi:hypothetical protein
MMKTHVRNLCVVLTLLGAVLLSGASADAEWFYDFNDGLVPEDILMVGLKDSGAIGTPPSASAEKGFLRLTEGNGLAPFMGGMREGDAYGPEVFLGDVRVSAKINIDGRTDDLLGVAARVGGPMLYEGYYAYLSFSTAWSPGHLIIGKNGTDIYRISTDRVADLARSYFLELLVNDDTSTGYTTAAARVLEYDGGPVLLQVDLLDSSLGGIPAWKEGFACVWAAEPTNYTVFNGTFDDIRAVPEPSMMVLLLTGAVGMGLWLRRRKEAA